MTVANSYFTLG